MARPKKVVSTEQATEAKPKTTGCGRGRKKTATGEKFTLSLTNEQAENAETVAVAGDFNNWDTKANVMTKTLEGFNIEMTLPKGTYQFKYVLNGEKWITDPTHPKQDNGLGSENSVIEL